MPILTEAEQEERRDAKARARARQEAAKQNREKAYRLWLAGYKYREIAEQCGYRSKQVAEYNVRSYRGQENRETRLEARYHVIEILEALRTRIWPAAANGDVRAIDSIVKMLRLESDIAGLFAPRQMEHSGPDGGPITIDQLSRMSERELNDLLSGLFARASTAGAGTGGAPADGAGAASGAAETHGPTPRAAS